jgi:hypothetical protein
MGGLLGTRLLLRDWRDPTALVDGGVGVVRQRDDVEDDGVPHYILIMCGRITQKSPLDQLRLTILVGTSDDPRLDAAKKRREP